MKRRIERGSVFVVGRRGFLGGGLAGGLVGGLGVAAGSFTSASAPAKYSRSGRARPAEPWVNLREEVIPPDELGPSGDDLAG